MFQRLLRDLRLVCDGRADRIDNQCLNTLARHGGDHAFQLLRAANRKGANDEAQRLRRPLPLLDVADTLLLVRVKQVADTSQSREGVLEEFYPFTAEP